MRSPFDTGVPFPVRVPPRLRFVLAPPRPLTEVQSKGEKSRGLRRLRPETTLIKIRTRDIGEGCQRLHLWKKKQTDVTGPGLRVFDAEADSLSLIHI